MTALGNEAAILQLEQLSAELAALPLPLSQRTNLIERVTTAHIALREVERELAIVAEQADRALKSAIAWEKQARLSEAEVQRLQQTPDYARNPDGSYVTPEQTDEGWAVQ